MCVGVHMCRCRHGKCILGMRICRQMPQQVCASIYSVAHMGPSSTPYVTHGLWWPFFSTGSLCSPERRHPAVTYLRVMAAACCHLSESYGWSILLGLTRPPVLPAFTPPRSCSAEAAASDGGFAVGGG